MSVFQVSGILPTPMDETQQGASADWEKLYDLILAECDRIVAREGLYVVNGIHFNNRSDATMYRMGVAEKNVRERGR